MPRNDLPTDAMIKAALATNTELTVADVLMIWDAMIAAQDGMQGGRIVYNVMAEECNRLRQIAIAAANGVDVRAGEAVAEAIEPIMLDAPESRKG